MIQISLKAEFDNALRSLAGLEKQVEVAAQQAINRVAATAKSIAVKSISSETGIQQKLVRDRIAIFKASRSALSAVVSAFKYAPNLIRYQAKQTKAGVSAKAWNQRKVYRGTFIGNKGRTVFKRVGKARLPIKAVYGPSIPQTFIKARTTEAMIQAVQTRWPTEFDAALANQLRRAGL